jgi:cardiolipin synthase A/B
MAAVLSACTSISTQPGGPAEGAPPSTTTAQGTAGPPAPGPPGVPTLIEEPDQGLAPIYSFLSSARGALDMTMYELADQQAESILAADAARGVDVRVILDQKLEKSNNSAAFSYLSTHGVHVVWAPTSFDAVHEKAAVADGRKALIMTLNLTSRYYSDTRDYAVVDDAGPDAQAIEAVFDADFTGSPAELAGADLVWSPGSEHRLEQFISSAHRTLLVENEEMSNRGIVSALEAAARRGVLVEVIMTDTGRYGSELSALSSAGVKVRTYPNDPSVLYIHAKAMVADGTTAFVGSENFTTSSLQYNRELGLITSDASVVNGLASVMSKDFAGSP